ncbi:hypothetical protein DPMN_098434 [Dreissena polymorpha]|uniref:Uncharacterized protein n=1 Tax=Dreissena polymorpha TaxID=45954 RepID=A0A9D4LDL6_DREPO|nr:hypothetical protein DPMN_098434 [Dreissena polymorpha]
MVVEDRNRKLWEQVTKVEEKTEIIDFALSTVNSKSMRNNYMFSGITEPRVNTNEDTESTLRAFLREKMKLAKEEAASIKL